MSIFAICIVKDEVDVLERTIHEALVWADKIIIIDHSSTDGTWELINDKLSHLDKVDVYGKITDDFTDGLRSLAYNKYKELAKNGDWWCRLDADEIYIDNPQNFLSNVSNIYDIVQCASFQYYFTEIDFESYQKKSCLYTKGAAIDNLKYFSCNSSEARFIRHHNRMWEKNELWPKPKFPNLIYPKHIRLKHFQYCYPEQIQHRLDLRTNKIDGNPFRHEIRSDWKNKISAYRSIDRTQSSTKTNQGWDERIMDSKNLILDNGNMDYVVDTKLLDLIRNPITQVIRNFIKLFLRLNILKH